jgi:hypothetical protein
MITAETTSPDQVIDRARALVAEWQAANGNPLLSPRACADLANRIGCWLPACAYASAPYYTRLKAICSETLDGVVFVEIVCKANVDAARGDGCESGENPGNCPTLDENARDFNDQTMPSHGRGPRFDPLCVH